VLLLGLAWRLCELDIHVQALEQVVVYPNSSAQDLPLLTLFWNLVLARMNACLPMILGGHMRL
jgi:hypothetical protein